MGSRGNVNGCGREMVDDNGSFLAIILHMNSVNGEDKNGLLYRTRTKKKKETTRWVRIQTLENLLIQHVLYKTSWFKIYV